MRIENYKGIEFVRISGMTEEQQALIHKTFDKSRIIKILRDHEVLSDCIQASHYQEWLNIAKTGLQESPEVHETISELRLAFK